MSRPSRDYEARRPGECALYQIVRDHFETFRARAATLRDGEGLPAFVEDEFRGFLRCGWLAGGFARFRCTACGLDRLVAFSCKGRGFCPSCGGRRMAERAAHLVDDVFPDVPVRQWVLTLPNRLRYQLAWNHDLCRAVVAIFMRAVECALRGESRRTGCGAGRGGGVAIVQRFGGALNLNIHIHALVLDGVFVKDRRDAVRFHRAADVRDLDVAETLATVAARVRRLLDRRGLGDAEDAGARDGWEEEAPALAGLASASVQGSVAITRDGVRRLGHHEDRRVEPALGPRHARANGFDLHADLVVPAGQRDRLESVCRYALRPPVGAEHLQVTDDGRVRLQLRHRWADGTTHLLFDPVEFLGRLAVLVPRPRINLLLYHGVLGPRAAWRQAIVPRCGAAPGSAAGSDGEKDNGSASGGGRLWAELMKRTFGFDVLACPRCGGRLRLVALVEQAAVVARILAHLGLPVAVPAPSASRAPPLAADASHMRWETPEPSIDLG